MKKIIINENQVNLLVNNIVTEQVRDKYTQLVECNVYSPGVTYKGQSVDDITMDKITLTFDIDLEYRSYGIKDIVVGNISGPSQLTLQIYNETNDDEIEIPFDWSTGNVKKETYQMAYIGIDQSIDIELMNDQNGNVVVKEITVSISSI